MSENRDGKGRFVNGHSGGPGRPKRRTEADYLVALGEAVSIEDWSAIVAKAVEQAKGGEDKARNFLARYLLGNPGADALPLSEARPEGEDSARLTASWQDIAAALDRE